MLQNILFFICSPCVEVFRQNLLKDTFENTTTEEDKDKGDKQRKTEKVDENMEIVKRKKKKEEKKAAQKALTESKERDKEIKQKDSTFYLRNNNCENTPNNGTDPKKHMEIHKNRHAGSVPSVDNTENYPFLPKSQASAAQLDKTCFSIQGGTGSQDVPGRESTGRLAEVLNFLTEAVKELQRDSRRREKQERQVWS